MFPCLRLSSLCDLHTLQPIISQRSFICQQLVQRYCSSKADQYDLVVIGGGSGGLACSKEAAILGKKVAVLDFVDPSSQGTTWGLGGTCVNVGCIPKKLMHQAAILGHHLKEATSYGWTYPSNEPATHDWSVLVENVTNYIKSLNFGHRTALMDKNVQYINAKGSLLDGNRIMTINKKNEKKQIYADNIVIATGMRPKTIQEVPGMTENSITSDDIFWLNKPPGKTLVIGGSYVALECAGFLSGLGYDTTLMLRSIPLRGFDQQMADLVLRHLEHSGVHIVRGTPKSNTKQKDGRLEVTWQSGSDVYDTVLLAIGREANTKDLGILDIGVDVDQNTGHIVGGYGGESERTSIPNIYAIGDILHGRPELTPVAIQAGKLLARRLYGTSLEAMDYELIPTTVFTPLEYSCAGLSEEEAESRFPDEIEVYHSYYKPLEYSLPHSSSEHCYIKVVCLRQFPHKVIGIHITGPNSGEVLQGFAVAMRTDSLTLQVLQSSVGIHPTTAEELVKLHITKRSGLDPTVSEC